jgi:hypothetical protein
MSSRMKVSGWLLVAASFVVGPVLIHNGILWEGAVVMTLGGTILGVLLENS